MNPTLVTIERAKLPVFAVGVLLAGFAWSMATMGNVFEDLFIYRAGAELPRRGVSPYDTDALRAEVARQFPDATEFRENCGFFLTPQAVACFTPFALLPWPVARDRKSTRLNSSHSTLSRMPSSA